MKFLYNSFPNRRARHGKLFDFSRFPERALDTPLLLLNTKGGSIPHITYEVLQLLSKEEHAIQIPLTSTILSYEAVKEFSKGIAHFCGLKNYVSYCSVQDPSLLTPVGYNKQSDISLWTNSGRLSVNPDRYMDTIEAFQPDFYQTLSNSDTDENTTKKKLQKTIKSSKVIFERCLKRHQESETLQKSGLVGVIEGGYDVDARKEYANFLSEQPVVGYAIEGLHNNGPEVENMENTKALAVLDETLKCLPEDKFRILHGCWRPQIILQMVEMGVDIFDTSLPFILTERNNAFVFKWTSVSMDSNKSSNKNANLEISLKEEKYKEDFSPILEGCTCLPCRKHTKAYIYHLIENKELLTLTLLMMHNLHHYMEFFTSIREALSRGEKIILE